ncbi:MAG: hypothetical protein V4534_06860 [Myxococcota bacterium]
MRIGPDRQVLPNVSEPDSDYHAAESDSESEPGFDSDSFDDPKKLHLKKPAPYRPPEPPESPSSPLDSNPQSLVRIEYPDGKIYEGQTLKGVPHGQGTFKYKNGAIYTGAVQNGESRGRGKLTYASGESLEGEFSNNYPQGYGTRIYSTGQVYKGEMLDGTPHGKGVYTMPHGQIFKGVFQNGQLSGEGEMSDANGVTFSGTMRDWQFVGRVTMTDPTGVRSTGRQIGNEFVGDLESLSDLNFGALLTGRYSEAPRSYPLGAITDFLRINGFETESDALQFAQDNLLSQIPTQQRSLEIHRNLATGKPILMAYGNLHHAMLINIEKIDENHVCVSLFNSGEGLDKYHATEMINGKIKHQTVLKYAIPIEQLSPNIIEKMLTYEQFNDITESYELISKIPGAQKLEPKIEDAIWQTAQKSGNCALECIFAALRNQMPLKEYTRMRRLLFEATITGLETKSSRIESQSEDIVRISSAASGSEKNEMEMPESEARAEVIEALKRKVHKRDSRLAVLEMTDTKDFTLPDNSVYTGGMKDGRPHGQGTVKYASGGVYVGDMKKGLPNGKGVLTYGTSGAKYVGDLTNGQPSGIGTFQWPSGATYTGEFRDGSANGQGIYRHEDGAVYEGEMVSGQPSGKGIYKPLQEWEQLSKSYLIRIKKVLEAQNLEQLPLLEREDDTGTGQKVSIMKAESGYVLRYETRNKDSLAWTNSGNVSLSDSNYGWSVQVAEPEQLSQPQLPIALVDFLRLNLGG